MMLHVAYRSQVTYSVSCVCIVYFYCECNRQDKTLTCLSLYFVQRLHRLFPRDVAPTYSYNVSFVSGLLTSFTEQLEIQRTAFK